MALSPVPSEVDVADVLQQQLIYNGEVLDIAFDSVRAYKEGTQSLAYLDSSIYLAYALFRMLEQWGKKRSGRGEMYVRRKEKARRKRRGACGVQYAIFHSLTCRTRHREGGRWRSRRRGRAAGRAGRHDPRDHVYVRHVRGGTLLPVLSRMSDEPRSPEIRALGHYANPARVRRTVQRVHLCRPDEARREPDAPAGREGEGGRAILQCKTNSYRGSVRSNVLGRCPH